jgi:hypothetical protein
MIPLFFPSLLKIPAQENDLSYHPAAPGAIHNHSSPPLLRLSLLRKSKLAARKSPLWRDYAGKASAQLLRIADSGFFLNPHSAFKLPGFP